MLADDIANKIKALNISGVPVDSAGGQIVRVATLESDLPNGVIVKSPLDGLRKTPEMPGYISGAMQVIVRHKDPEAGNLLAEAISSALTVVGDPVDLAHYRLTYFCPLSEPIMYPDNEANLFEFSINFDCRAVRL